MRHKPVKCGESADGFSPPPISGAISGEYFEEGQRCPSSLSALRNVAVNGVATHHESVGLEWSTFIPRVTQCMRGHNSTIHRLQVAKCTGGHNSTTITHRVTQCTRGHNSTTETDTLDTRFKALFRCFELGDSGRSIEAMSRGFRLPTHTRRDTLFGSECEQSGLDVALATW